MTEPQDDLFGALSTLPAFTSPDDRYRGFRRVLMENDDGKRVLREILSWARMLNVAPPLSPVDPYLLAYHEGERHVGSKLIDTVMREPQERPAQAKRTRGEG